MSVKCPSCLIAVLASKPEIEFVINISGYSASSISCATEQDPLIQIQMEERLGLGSVHAFLVFSLFSLFSSFFLFFLPSGLVHDMYYMQGSIHRTQG